jgi:xanthine dehydrogenase accessory factor
MATRPLPANVHQAVVDAIDRGGPFALAVVLRSSGSVPREAGTKAIIDASGAIHGTIGGGLLESEAQRLAVASLSTMRPAVFELRFSGASAELNDPVCGGTMRVLVDPATARHKAAYAAACEAMRRRQRGVLLTTVVDREFPRVHVQWLSADAVPQEANGAPATAMRAALARQVAEAFVDSQPAGQTEGLAEPVVPSARLLVAGGGHVGQALAAHANLVGFEVVVVEDRAEFADAALYPPGVTVRCGGFADVLHEFPIDRDTYVAIVGRGHRVDIKALAACIDKPAAYIGMMGSRRKVALVRKAFLESAQATAEQFARVYAPIGLNLGAETVPEIAASIVAQLVAVRRTGRAPSFDSAA